MKIITYILLLTTTFVYSQTKNIDFSKFKGEESKIEISKEYSFTNLYDYKINSQNFDSLVVKPYNQEIPENLVVLKYLPKINTNKKDTIVFSIVLAYKLTIDIQGLRHVFIKYRTQETEEKNDYQVFTANKENNIWKENLVKTEEIKLLESILQNASINLLYKFYDKRDNPKTPEINKLKSLAKNGDLLDIKKLAKVLIENKETLLKYLDK